MLKSSILFNSNQVKFIAIAAMTIDHIAWAAYPGYSTEWLALGMHILGRITCPIMCYCIAEGYHYSKNLDRYTARLFLFALLSHFAYLFASSDFAGLQSFVPFSDGSLLNQTSVMWSLAWGLVMLRTVNSQRIQSQQIKVLLVLLICLITLPSDWSCIAALWILSFGTNRNNFRVQMQWMMFYAIIYAAVYFWALDPIYGIIQLSVILAVPILRGYNGQRGRNPRINHWVKWLFYLYYPLHLLIIGFLQMI